MEKVKLILVHSKNNKQRSHRERLYRRNCILHIQQKRIPKGTEMWH